MSVSPSPASALLRSPRTLGILGAVVFVLLACVGGGFFVAGQNAQPGGALAGYCADLTRQKYAEAYGLLSSGARAKLSQDRYVQASQYRDQIDGKVKSCDSPQAKGGGLSLTFLNASAIDTLRITRNTPASGKVLLTHQVDGWKVDQLEPQLEGTDVAPIFAAQGFCDALAKADYAGAYADLSAGQKAAIGQADWTKRYADALGSAGGKITKCSPNVGSYSVKPGSATLEMLVQLQVTVGGGSATPTIPFTLTLVPEGGAWKVDTIKATGV